MRFVVTRSCACTWTVRVVIDPFGLFGGPVYLEGQRCPCGRSFAEVTP